MIDNKSNTKIGTIILPNFNSAKNKHSEKKHFTHKKRSATYGYGHKPIENDSCTHTQES